MLLRIEDEAFCIFPLVLRLITVEYLLVVLGFN